MERGEEPSKSILPEGHKPKEGLQDHGSPKHREEVAHDPDALRVRSAQVVIAAGGGHQPAEGVGLSLGDRLVVQLCVEVRRIDGESELPVGQQYRGDDQAKQQRDERRPAEAVQTLGLDGRGANNDATRTWAARRVPVRWRIPVTTLS